MEPVDLTKSNQKAKRHWHGKHSIVRISTIVASVAVVATVALRLYFTGYFVNDVQTPLTMKLSEQQLPPAITLPQQPSWYEFTIQKNDTLLDLLTKNNIKREDVFALLNLPRAKKYLNKLQPNHQLKLSIDEEGYLQEFMYEIKPTEVLMIERGKTGFTVNIEEMPLDTRLVYNMGYIDSTLYHAGKKYSLPAKIVLELEQILGWQIDFNRDIRPGDQFKIIYKKHFVGKQEVSTGNIVAVEFVNKGNKYQAIRFTAPNGATGYYTPEGNSLQKAFLRTPVDYTRISSPFNPDRMHPILKIRRPHLGVDLAAPYGTPVKAAGDGVVTLAGHDGGYGIAVIIDHGNEITTLYAHLRRIANTIHKGKAIKQGDILGYVGSTGLASGPHLHYEYRVNNQHKNAMTVKLPLAKPVDKAYRSKFAAQATTLLAQLDKYSQTQLAEVEGTKANA